MPISSGKFEFMSGKCQGILFCPMSGNPVRNFKPLASFCCCAGWFESYVVKNPESRFSRDEAQILVPLSKKTCQAIIKFTLIQHLFSFSNLCLFETCV